MKNVLTPVVLALFAATLFTSCQKELVYYTVTFDANNYYSNEKVTVIAVEGELLSNDFYMNPPQNLRLRGWYREPEAINEWNFGTDVVTGDMTLYAGWSRLFTFTFHGNGGAPPYSESGDTWTEGYQQEGDRLRIPANVTKPGYVLEGWYKDAALTDPWNFDTDFITGDTDIYAKWAEGIAGLTRENYPRVDGATSTRILNVMVACKLLGLPYGWDRVSNTDELCIVPEGEGMNPDGSFIDGRIQTSQTHGAIMNLINRNVDIILRSTTASPDEKAAADAAGVTLVQTPIALDAFVFVKNAANPVRSLTLEQIRKIFTQQITDWLQVGGNRAPISVYTRPRNSGSEEALRELVMDGQEPAEFPEEQHVWSMAGVFLEMDRNPYGISYIFKNYKDMVMMRPNEPVFAINGIAPDATTIKDRTYPLTTELYAIIRSDLDRTSMGYKLYEWLQTQSAEIVLQECGFTSVR
ncbi:MAG: substrate-binding domain-containing protein [Tannerellaceae bacterium]|jgi:phosphate transport system substrate-binding protein|nr:substrate-binding domain-containing protein [Tannerellaceae bacterium]